MKKEKLKVKKKTLSEVLKKGREKGQKAKTRVRDVEVMRKTRATDADPKKVKAFKASDNWRIGFCDRKDITLRVQTNKKSRSAIKRSRMVRNFHWFMMYKAPLTYSDRKP